MFIDLSLPLREMHEENTGQREADLFRLGHHGTHLDRLLGSTIPLEYCKSRAILFDVSDFSSRRSVECDDVPLDLVRKDDFVLFRTGAMLRNPYASKDYMKEFIEFSWEMIERLLAKDIRFIGLDARGLRMNEEHRKADTLCEKAGTYVIENIANTERLPPAAPFTLHTAWFDAGGTGMPCKLIAETANEAYDAL